MITEIFLGLSYYTLQDDAPAGGTAAKDVLPREFNCLYKLPVEFSQSVLGVYLEFTERWFHELCVLVQELGRDQQW